MNKILNSQTSPLCIDTIDLVASGGQIGMTFCPGKKDRGYSGVTWDRDLDVDLDVISAWGANAVVTLLEEFELEMLGVNTLPSLLQSRGIEWYHLPIRDVDIPDHQFEKKWMESWQQLRTILMGKGKILLHCRGGLGRTGVIAARMLVELGFKPSDAMTLVRITRHGAIETRAQEQYVLQLKNER